MRLEARRADPSAGRSGLIRLNPTKSHQKNKNYQTNPSCREEAQRRQIVIFRFAHEYSGLWRSGAPNGKKRTHFSRIHADEKRSAPASGAVSRASRLARARETIPPFRVLPHARFRREARRTAAEVAALPKKATGSFRFSPRGVQAFGESAESSLDVRHCMLDVRCS